MFSYNLKHIVLDSLLYLTILLLSNEAFAGAWLRKKGESEFISQFEYKTLFNYYTDPIDNHKYLSKTFFFEFYSLFYQYGLNDKLTIGIEEKWFNYKGYQTNYYDDSDSYTFFEENELMLNDHYKKFENRSYETKFFLQTPLWSNEYAIFSIQPSFEFYNHNLDRAIELSALYGYSFKLGKEYSYINIEYGLWKNIKNLWSTSEDKIKSRLDVTLGLAVTKKHTAILQLFNRNNNGIFRDQITNIVQFSWQYNYNQNLSWQTGYSTNLTKRNQYITESITTGILIKF